MPCPTCPAVGRLVGCWRHGDTWRPVKVVGVGFDTSRLDGGDVGSVDVGGVGFLAATCGAGHGDHGGHGGRGCCPWLLMLM